MPRIVLLGLGNEDVDVLTRLSHLDPSPEVLAVHPDPGALILRLASVASYPALTEPPRARPDDIVVVPSSEGPMDAQLVRAWREAGARILMPDAPSLVELVEHLDDLGPAPKNGGDPEAPQAVVAAGAGPAETELPKPPEMKKETPVTASDSMDDKPVEAPPAAAPQSVSAPGAPVETATPAPPPGAADTPAPAVSSAPPPVAAPEPPPVSVWERPEDTFRYLVEQTLGADRPVSLWWDGAADVWVPWVWTGSVPTRRPEPPGFGVDIPSRWGSFRLAVEPEDVDRVPVAAFARVAEDMALRDLMLWREESRRFATHGRPEPDMDAAAIQGWAEPLLAHLKAETALIWKREDDRYRLLHAAGGGLEFSGDLVMPAVLMAATFETDAAGWRRWDPLPWLRIHLGAAGQDPQAPLRLRRLELALAGEDRGW